MSTRVISDRELLHNLRFEVEELREQVAELGVKVERVAVIAGADDDEHSVRVGAQRVSTYLHRARAAQDTPEPARVRRDVW